MKNNIWSVVIGVAIVAGLIGWYFGSTQKAISDSSDDATKVSESVTFSRDMRKLWEDHIAWTRSWIISEAYATGGADADATRLLKNQEDIGNAIKPYYGEEAGNKLTELLKTHITTAVKLVQAAKAGDNTTMTATNDAWYANGTEIADFLADANPNWSRDEVRSMMKQHLDLTKQEAVDILQKNHEAGVSDYDKVHDEILTMSDMLSSGIVKQFPEKF